MRESPLMLGWLGVRAALFWVVLALSTVVYSVLAIVLMPLPADTRYRIIMTWASLNIWWLKVVCGVNYRVEGREHLPKGPAVVLSKHQSSWETLAFAFLFPPQVWVLKRELLHIPFFGWGLAAMSPIAIDRKAGRTAIEQVVRQGTERIRAGRWVVVYPEGTRMAPGTKGRYKLGGAILAAKAGVPVVPVAHNAGHFWPRHQFIKWPGTITVRIGPAIDTTGLSPEEINARAEAWIEAQMVELGHNPRNLPT